MNPHADMHVHSTFSDGKGTIEENIAAAEALGLTALGCVDHVRADTDWVPEYVAAVAAAARRRPRSSCAAGSRPSCSTPTGALDLPDGIDGRRRDLRRRPPGAARRRARRTRARCKERIEAGDLSAADVIDAILTSTARALDRPERIVIAHFLSILPKIGLDRGRRAR